jgi:ADP-dependent NAD(P)H-hydrate dehydratase / NAD(P)H-hydrate epimerase
VIPLPTADEMRLADRRVTERYGVPSLLLMENAGRGAVDALVRVLGPVEGRRIVVVCGKGSNGGDGFVVARHLLGRGARVSAWLVGRGGEVQGDARVNLEALRRAGESVVEASNAGRLRVALGEADVVVDALLGTGVRGVLREPVRSTVELIRRASADGIPVVAVDTPTAVDLSSGEPSDPAVRADLTVTFHRPKTGLLTRRGAAHAGKVLVAPIGIPADADRG